MKTPPVIPVGLEYLITALKRHGYEFDVLDLCFATSSVKDLEEKLKQNTYDIVGFTIRNIDSCIFFNNEFFLPDIRKLIQLVRAYNIPVILGGAGFSAMPQEILDYLKADYGIIGPGEVAFPRFLELWRNKKLTEKIIIGWPLGPDSTLTHLRGSHFNYEKYLSDEGIVGFETHKGCDNPCPYCIEANTRVWFKKITNIIEEIKFISTKGYNHFHTCDSEFNANLDYSIEFCKALIKSEIPLKWALYMKPYPYSEELFQLLSESNAYLITLSVDSFKKIQQFNSYSCENLAEIINYCKKYKIKLAIDLLTGYPFESIESIKEMINFFKINRPSTVGISFYYRLSKYTSLGQLIKQTPSLQNDLTRPYSKDDNCLEPIFYSQNNQQQIEELISDDDLFKIAGLAIGVNYQLEEVKES